jgi:hypothetical protein
MKLGSRSILRIIPSFQISTQSREPQRSSHPRYLPSLYPDHSKLPDSSVGLIPYYPPTDAYVYRAPSFIPICQNKHNGLYFFPGACHMRNPSDINSEDTHYRLKYHVLAPTDCMSTAGRCEAPFLIRQIHSRPASYTYTRRSSPRYNCFL